MPVVDLTVESSMADLMCDVLWGMGVAGIEERESVIGSVTVRTSLGEDPLPLLESVRESIPSVSWSILGIDRKIVESWRDFVEVTMVGDHVAFVPAWIDAPDVQTVVRVEPFDTFGLGNHPTTVLAARMCALHAPHAAHALDFGCGSGVLAILMAQLGEASIVVNDIAASSRTTVEHNMRLNNVAHDRIAWCDDIGTAGTGSFDLVVANILAPVLKQEARRIRAVTARGGVVVLSGIRDDQVSDVVDHYQPCQVDSMEELDGWVAVSLRL